MTGGSVVMVAAVVLGLLDAFAVLADEALLAARDFRVAGAGEGRRRL
jgi:hypothetical protein